VKRFLSCAKSLLWLVISQTLKHVWDMFDFNITSNPHSYLALFVPKTLSVVWYFIMDLIPLKFHSYLALFKSKSMVIFICFHCLIIFFKLCKITQTLCGVFSSSNLNLSSSQTVDLVSFYFILFFFLFYFLIFSIFRT